MPPTVFEGQFPGSPSNISGVLDAVFDAERFEEITICVAWITRPGIEAISDRITEYLASTNQPQCRIIFGCKHGWTTVEAVSELLTIREQFDDEQTEFFANLQSSGTFHPKLFCGLTIENNEVEDIIIAVGSANLTEAALGTGTAPNSEAILLLDYEDGGATQPFTGVIQYLQDCSDITQKNVIPIDDRETLRSLRKLGFVSSEKEIKKKMAISANSRRPSKKLSTSEKIRRLRVKLGLDIPLETPSGILNRITRRFSRRPTRATSSSFGTGARTNFAAASRLDLQLSPSDITSGAESYILIPLGVADFFPPVASVPDRVGDEARFRIRVASGTPYDENVRLYSVGQNRDFRFSIRNAPTIRDAMDWSAGGIVSFERLDQGTQDDPLYRISVIPPTDSGYPTRLAALDASLSSRWKRATAFP